MRRKKLSRREAMLKALNETSNALSRAYAHPNINREDIQSILGSLYALHVDRGADLGVHLRKDLQR